MGFIPESLDALRKHNLTEADSDEDKDLAFGEEAFSYSKVRHAANGYHHFFKAIVEKSRGQDLVQVLHSLDLLNTWSFSESDIDLINTVRNYREPEDPIISIHYYNQYVNGDPVQISGILPYLNTSHCPTLSIH